MQQIANKRSRKRDARLVACVLMLCICIVVSNAAPPSLAGKWVSQGRTLHNGEVEKTLLELRQDGSKLTGTVHGMGYIFQVVGTATGTHFELYRENAQDKRPLLVGDLKDGKLVGRQWGHIVEARPATPADEFPKLPYLEPPALHQVPSNGLAQTPPMGWNSWNLFADRIDDQTVRTMADAMVSSGMRDAGYIYVNIDDTWEGLRDEHGTLHSNSKFPDMKALADYVHSKGLKIGIYSSPGPRTCGSYPASYGHEAQDARMFAEWGIDYLKYDWCSAASIYGDEHLQPVYQKMGHALQATGRPIVYSLCEYGMGKVETWGADVGGNLWRTTDDIRDEWASMMENIELQAHTAPFAGPGHWNDPDMLEIGNGHMTGDEYRTHMSLWALTAAPLLAGNDIRSMSAETRSILLNKEVIAVDQDPLGKQASPVRKGELETWVKPLADGGIAVGIVNLSSQSAQTVVRAADLLSGRHLRQARDLWAHADVAFKDGAYAATIQSHATLLLRLSAE